MTARLSHLNDKGEANMVGHGSMKLSAEGKDPLKWRRGHDGHQIEHDDLFAARDRGREQADDVHPRKLPRQELNRLFSGAWRLGHLA